MSEHWFLPTAGAGLAVAGLAKFVSALGGGPIVLVVDPILGLPYRSLLLGLGLLELFIAWLCLCTDRRRFSLPAVAWLSTTFLVYRLVLWFVGSPRSCPCLGNLPDVLHLSPGAADNIVKGLLAYLLLGSYASFFWLSRRIRRGEVGS